MSLVKTTEPKYILRLHPCESERDLDEKVLPGRRIGEPVEIRFKYVYYLSDLLMSATDSGLTVTDIDVAATPQTLGFIVEYLNHHQGATPAPIAKPLERDLENSCSDTWNVAFIEHITRLDPMRIVPLYDIIHAAHQLKIASLASLGLAKLADRMMKVPLRDIPMKALGYTEDEAKALETSEVNKINREIEEEEAKEAAEEAAEELRKTKMIGFTDISHIGC